MGVSLETSCVEGVSIVGLSVVGVSVVVLESCEASTLPLSFGTTAEGQPARPTRDKLKASNESCFMVSVDITECER